MQGTTTSDKRRNRQTYQYCLTKKPKQLIDLLVKEIRLYNDKIEIDLHFTDKKSPDDENHWDFCFYQCEKSYIVDTHVFKSKPKEYRVKIKLKV